MIDPDVLAILRCPVSGEPLAEVGADWATARDLRPSPTARQSQAGRPASVLAPAGGDWAYPVVEGIPLLTWPEALHSGGDPRGRSVPGAAAYEASYRDLDHYTAIATPASELEATSADHGLDRLARARPPLSFPLPSHAWLAGREGAFDISAAIDAYRHLAPIERMRVAQVGGRGVHAVKFLLAGAECAILLTPFLQEALFARALARRYDMERRLQPVVGIAEAMPLAGGCLDRIFSPGSLHHTEIPAAAAEFGRVLAPGGRLACVDPWRAPGYALGTRLLGKQEAGVHCVPLTWERVAPARAALPGLRVVHHGAASRYPLLALGKLGARLPPRAVHALTRVDDAVCRPFPALRRLGSSATLLWEKSVA